MMKRYLTIYLTGAALAGALIPLHAQTGLTVQNLRCEYLVNPLGIDVVKPRLSWVLASGPRGRQQTAYQILVASSPEILQKNRGDRWDTGRVASTQTANVAYEGNQQASGARSYWKIRYWDERGRVSAWSQPAMWSMGLLKDSDWSGPWIGGARPADIKAGVPLPFPWLRKTFNLNVKPREAFAYVNALGYYELYVNGQKVDDYVLSPAVTDYSKRTLYVTHDITKYLVKGDNCVALWLGRGWYVRGHPGVVHDGPLVRAQFTATMPDGGDWRMATDTTWKVRSSPITPLGKGTAFGDYGGEHYDARLELEGWNKASLNDADWMQAAVFEPPHVITSAQLVQPNRIEQTILPVSVKATPDGGYLVDMGKNFVGWLELHLPASTAAGQNLRLEYADFRPAGNRFMTFNQRDEYVTRAGSGQVFCSRFNYHGFQYVHITGLSEEPSLQNIKGYFIRTDYTPASTFESSSDLLNQIYRTAGWTYQNLTIGGYVVDCPTRERLGYGGDAGTSLETGMFDFDTSALYSKWTSNWRDAQAPNGDLPYTAPAYPEQGGGGPMWSGFSVTLPWQLYLQYGDRKILEVSYEPIRKWLAFAETKTADHVLEPYVSYGITPPQWNFLGDWVTPRSNQGAPRDTRGAKFINNCHYLYQLQLAAKIAGVLGKEDDRARYEARAGTLAQALHQRFFDAGKGVYVNGEEAYQALPLLLHMMPADLRETVARHLEETLVTTRGGHLDTGMHGTYFLLKQLMESDRNDLIYTFTSKTDYPSWGNMLEQGATTFWESWTGGSHIHDTLISIGSWFIQGVGGIRIDEKSPGFDHFSLKPAMVGDLSFARAQYQSMHGQIVSDWRRENGKLHLKVTIPAGTTATIYVPSSAPEAITEGGRPAKNSPGVRPAGVEKGKAVFEVNSGEYQFVAELSH